MLPWVVADAGAFLGDTVTTLLTFHPIKFANTWYLYALNEHGVTLPFWVTGAAMVGVVAVAAYAVWRRRPGVDELLRWLALVLAVANLVNKQAFYNQFWLVGALVAASLALPQGERRRAVGVDGEGLDDPAPLAKSGALRRLRAVPTLTSRSAPDFANEGAQGQPGFVARRPSRVSHRSVSSARVVPSTDTRAASVAASASASEPVDAPAVTSRRSAASPWSWAISSTACHAAR